ncbi:hypothetical protein PVAND_009895 [Polypedilum vanderplanki]|uniref:Uncharacterized protein n=1 Tax=Polypedilum vanderplanki TaxID=319348 RepID=A0A9J6CE71_POLVA|nr:hypothetical protein PVAND_009895 [Polypedilum vanderplanki]
MNRWYQPDVFIPHSDYFVPVAENLLSDTYHPETNSLGYTYKVSQYKRPSDYLPFYTSLTQSKEGLFALASNNFNTVQYDCVIGASHSFDNYIASDYNGAKFKIHMKESAYNVEFLTDSLFLATTNNNVIDFYNTKEPLIDNNIMKRVTRLFSDGKVTQTLVLDNYRILVGTKKGSIECYEYSNSDSIQTLFSFLNAHQTEIKGLSAVPNKINQWMSCSSFEVLYWDKRQIYPARAVLERHNIMSGLTSIDCYKDYYFIITDNSGEILVYDIRCSINNVVFQMTINDKIDKVQFNGENKFSMISGNSNKIKFFEINKIQETVQVHEQQTPEHIYSMCWDKTGNKNDTCYIVGKKKYAKEIQIKAKV